MDEIIDIKVLFVEDEPIIRNSIERTLSLLVKKVYSAKDGIEALEMFKNNKIDLVITDIRMPHMDGLTLIEKLRENNIEIPIIIVSAYNEIEYLHKAIDLKVDNFINKPIKIVNLIGLISEISKNIIRSKDFLIKKRELEHYRQAIEYTNLVVRISKEGKILSVNNELKEYFQRGINQKNEITLLEELLDLKYIDELLETTKKFKIYNKTIPLTYHEGKYTVIITAFASIFDDENFISEITIMFNNITQILKEKDEIIKQLYTDTLTFLPNRQKLFYDIENKYKDVGLLIVDIDSFFKFNHIYGFDIGDEILKQLAILLKNYCSNEKEYILYKGESDHFIILSKDKKNFHEKIVNEFAQRIIQDIQNHTFNLKDNLYTNISITIGASFTGEKDLFTEATLASNIAKMSKKSFKYFNESDDLKEDFKNNLNTQFKIKKAIDDGLIVNYYQPIVDADGEVLKYESLIRMCDPDNPNVVLEPAAFLPIAKQSKNYPLLTKKVIDTVFKDGMKFKHHFSINISFEDIENPEITFYLESMLQKHKNFDLTIELLETEGLKDIEKTIKFCNIMKSYGVKIAIDDFGAGYSNFIYFHDIPIDTLKIDGSLVKRVHEYRGHMLLDAIVRFAKNLGIITIAEFVEDEKTLEKLKKIGVDYFQGYYFSKPKPLSELE
ncbi:MAG: hypothetical protein C0625_07565 [Arcobacter sp.]|nr:MAG: hypothetical protein C0625_07565 [Arcobacter sp.]